MAFLSFETSHFMGELALAFYALRVEMCIFLAAFCAHALLFGKYRVLSRSTSKSKGKLGGGKMHSDPRSTPQTPQPDPKVPVSAEDVCKGCAGKPEAVVTNLRLRLAVIATDAIVPALLGLLRSAGRVPPVELLAAVRGAAKERSLSLNSLLGDMLLRGYYACHLVTEFDALLAEIEADAALKGEELADVVGLQALKGVLRKGDFQASLKRLGDLRAMWAEGPGSTPSAAPRALLQWLARIAVQQGSLPKLVEKLQELDIFASAFALVLAEVAQHGTTALMRETEALGAKEGLKFTNEAYCALLKFSEDAEHALRLFSEATKSAAANKELLVTAAAAALTHKSTKVADAIMKKLPVETPAEAAGKLLQLYGSTGMDNTQILNLYTKHFSSLDLSGDVAAEKLVAEACINLKCLDVLQKMLTTTSDCTKRVALIKNLGAAGHLDNAFVILRAFPEKGACLYNAIIDACIDNDRPEAAQEVVEEATKAGVADTVTYNTVIKAHLLAGKTAEAQKTVQLMTSAGCEPNCVTFNELLDACVKSKPMGDVWPIFSQMRACKVKPNRITGSILLKTIRSDTSAVARRNVERVLEVLDSMTEDMDEVLLSSVVEACIRAGRVDLLVPHLKRQTSTRRIQVQGAHTYGSIIRAYGFVNDVQSAWATWKDMRARHVLPTAITVGCMVEAVVSNGDPEAGYELIQDLRKDEQSRALLNAIIYCSVLKGFSHQKKFDRLWELYEEMRSLKLTFSIVTWNTMIDACSRSGQMNSIPDLLTAMVAEGIEPNLITYSAILKGYCQENRLEEAFELLQTCKEKFKPDEIMYNTVLDGCARQGRYEQGMKLLAEMEGVGINPSNFTLSVLVKLCSRAKKLDRAFEMVEEIPAKYNFRPNIHVYNNLIQASIQHKSMKRAFGTLECILNERIRVDTRTYSLLLRACVASGDAQDAAGLMRAAAGLRGVHPRLMGFDAKMLQPQGGLPSALISEVIEGLSGPCRQEALAVALLKDLRSKSNLKVDPKLQMRLTTQAVGSQRL